MLTQPFLFSLPVLRRRHARMLLEIAGEGGLFAEVKENRSADVWGFDWSE